MTIADQLRHIFADRFDARDVRPESTLKDDLQIDSLDAVELGLAIEDVTGIEVNEDEIENCRTVAHLEALIEGRRQ